MLGTLPIILTILVVMILTIVSIFTKMTKKELRRNAIVAFIVVIFLLHPTLTDASLSMFR